MFWIENITWWYNKDRGQVETNQPNSENSLKADRFYYLNTYLYIFIYSFIFIFIYLFKYLNLFIKNIHILYAFRYGHIS